MIVGGMFGGVVVAGLICLPLLFMAKTNVKIETLFIFFVVIYFFADNFSGVLSFAQNLRFVILGIGLVVLQPLKLFKYNLAFYILPFSIVATLITFSLSPLGLEATVRGVSYFLVALVVFKCVQLLVEHNAKRFYDLLLTVLALYFSFNFVVLFMPFLGENYIAGRFAGLMGNPNGLGMVAMFSYALIDILRAKNNTSFNRSFFSVFKVALIVLVVLTASRTALFSIFLYEACIRLLKHKIILAVVLLLMLFVYMISASISLEAVVSSLGLSEYLRVDTLEDASGRTEVWGVALEEIKNQPWLGKGILYDNYFILDYGERYFGEYRARHWYGIWNSYLSLLLNVGIIGVLAFSLFWYKMYALSRMKIVRFAFLMLCLFSAISESWMAASMNAFTPLVFLCWSLLIYQSKPNTKVT